MVTRAHFEQIFHPEMLRKTWETKWDFKGIIFDFCGISICLILFSFYINSTLNSCMNQFNILSGGKSSPSLGKSVNQKK